MSTPDSATNPLNSDQLMRTLLLDTQRQAEELSLLEQVRSALARETELDVIIRTVVEATARTFGYTQVSLYVLEGDVLVCQHQVGYAQVIERLPITLGVNGRVVRTATPALVPDVRQDPAFIASMEGIL